MKKIWILILWLCSIFLVWNFTQAKDYEYTNLSITANILEDWTIKVNEDFTADFFVSKHWIIRDIPLNYSVEWKDFHIEVSDIRVPWKNFTTSKNNWNIEIKIGDADRTIIWEQNYPISYTTYGLIRNFSWMWYAELYWNLVGYDFDTNINKVRAELILPKIYTWFTKDDFLITTDWTTKTIDWFAWRVNRSKWDRIIITYDKWLSAYHGITLAIKFPNDYFVFDHDRQAGLVGQAKTGFLESIWAFILIPIWMIALIIFSWINKAKNIISFFREGMGQIDRKSGQLKWDLAKQFPVIVQYEPPKWINSAEAGLLLNRWAKAKDMLSLIYKRAAEWLIKLSFEEEEDWLFFKNASKNVIITKIRDINPESPTYEKDFFSSLVRSEKNKISGDTNLYNKLGLSTLENYWRKNWRFTGGKDKGWLIAIGFVVLFLFINFFGERFPWLSILAFFGLFALGIYSKTSFKLKETEEWARLISHVLWYREFLAACDENKLRLFLQQDPLYFDKILPYAVVFWLDTELIKKIEPIMQEMNIRSSWYDGDIHSIYYINNTIARSANNSVPPKASYSSDSWFSGGSSFGGGFSSGGWWGGWGWRSW